MAKGTNSSKCLVEARGSKIGSTIRLDSFLTNSGFKFEYTVDLTGIELSREEIKKLGRAVCSFLDKNLRVACQAKSNDLDQLSLF